MATESSRRYRKLHYDEFTGSFYFETKVETLKRICRQRERQTGTRNRNEDRQMDAKHKQVDNAQHIFHMKNDRELSDLKTSLEDMVAHRRVLGFISELNKRDPALNENLGTYGLNTNYHAILPLIAIEKKLMQPAAKRQERAEILAKQRRKMEVIDRSLSTSAVFRKRPRRSRSVESMTAAERERSPAKLILPPIQVSKGQNSAPPTFSRSHSKYDEIVRVCKQKPVVGDQRAGADQLQMKQNNEADVDNLSTLLSSVFVTQVNGIDSDK